MVAKREHLHGGCAALLLDHGCLMNAFDPDIFAAENPCVCCAAPGDCACALPIPTIGDPYSDYATAEAAISDYTADCVGFSLYETSSFSADTSIANQLGTSASAAIAINLITLQFSITVSTSSLSIPFSVTTDGTIIEVGAFIYDCATLSEVASDTSTSNSGTLTLSGIPEGTYRLQLAVTLDPFSSYTNLSATFTATCSGVMAVNPVIALWDDSGTTRELEACPKMIIPLQFSPFGAAGNWYSDETDAQAAIDGAWPDWEAVECKGWALASDPGLTGSFSAGVFTGSIPCIGGGGGDLYYSVNLIGGETVSISSQFSINGSGDCNVPPDDTDCSYADAVFLLMYPDGTTVLTGSDSQEPGNSATASDSITVPYTGKYVIYAAGGANTWDSTGDTISIAVSVTATSAVTVNPIQALYDLSLECPGRLDCT